jgi:orotidine-5'-phosphate decarboxylase
VKAAGAGPGGPTFLQRWQARVAVTSHLAVGMGPSAERLGWWGLPDTLAAAQRQSREIVETVAPQVALLKMQTPFFERFGPAGLDLLRSLVESAHEAGALVVLDAKRCDAPDATAAFPELYLGPHSVLGGDALTVLPYMGMAALEPLLLDAAERSAAILLMVRTSNHAASVVQAATVESGHTVSQAVADAIGTWNRERPWTALGAVIGAAPAEARDLVARMDGGLASIPGLGRQGRTVRDVVSAAGDHVGRSAFPVTSGLLRGGGGSALVASLRSWTAQIRAACDEVALSTASGGEIR